MNKIIISALVLLTTSCSGDTTPDKTFAPNANAATGTPLAVNDAASGSPNEAQALPPGLGDARDWDEGGAVGCENGNGTNDQGRIILDRVSANDDCDDEPDVAQSGSYDFGTAGTILLSFDPVSPVFGQGSITHVPRRGARRTIHIDYMAEFVGMPAVDRVQIAYRGVLNADKGESTTVCEHRIDWQRNALVTSRWISGDPETRDNCENQI